MMQFVELRGFLGAEFAPDLTGHHGLVLPEGVHALGRGQEAQRESHASLDHFCVEEVHFYTLEVYVLTQQGSKQ